ncbi:dihydroorotate dehydrogenase-like protein [Aporhodopirellula aestuarii]|uniref:Dihydroorotate dehydrogenase-like protein n=1 Tax=Aporhodopirellula aestuarii TaxID=2950107 RepID=A0ABT0TZ68_9BACT|nr:dihydroorotate dehydrogenase-like protein [Aporhodopirellula aestuarii]MCM2369820.1 dihydroorotate dehydrogenase-like protein [Aporhodopirellula aestuarii]
MNANLSTRYLGLDLKNPLVVSACPLTGKLETLLQLEAAGAAAAVLPSLFEEQIEHLDVELAQMFDFSSNSNAESLNYFPEMESYNTGPEGYLAHLTAAKDAVKIPLIASLNGSSTGGWLRYAKMIEEAGADALELNVFIVPTEVGMNGQEVERRYIELVESVRRAISIPLAVKIGPYFSSPADMVVRLVNAGADGVVLFNRYLEPDIDLDTLDVVPHLVLSTQQKDRLPLRWIAVLRDRISASIAANTGIHDRDDVIKVLLAGADVAMMASALLQYGPNHLTNLLDQVQDWINEREYESVDQLKGSVSQANCVDPTAYERANYTRALVSYNAKSV